MIFAIELKKYIAYISILGVIIDKLRHKKKSYPIILLKVDKGLEVSFYYNFLFFGLTVYLWVEDGREFLHNAEEIA